MSEFTPGPWAPSRARWPIDGEYDYAIGAVIDGKPYVIAEVFGRVNASISPNARMTSHLIAAAPDLYAALVEAVRFLDYFANGRTGFVGGGTPLSCLEQARAALAAADWSRRRDAKENP